MIQPNFGIPLISTCRAMAADGGGPSIDGATWLSIMGPPPGPEMDGYHWTYCLDDGWRSVKGTPQ